MDRLQFEFRPYRRSFQRPLATAHGIWTVREGIIVRLSQAQDAVGYGEIAPIAWFGSETFEQAVEFCCQLPAFLEKDELFAVPNHLPACQFGLESAWESLQQSKSLAKPSIVSAAQTLPSSVLLPAGLAAFTSWQKHYQMGDRTFKWKIAVTELEQELAWLDQLCEALPEDCQLRLDANGGLDLTATKKWLERCDRSSSVEYLEQPLPPEQFQDLLDLQKTYSTSIALDESVATLHQLVNCYEKGWRGVVVIKPAIAGSPAKLRQLCRKTGMDAVFSSVFETSIGRRAGLALAAELSNPDRAVGYGTGHWFPDDFQDAEALWQSL